MTDEQYMKLALRLARRGLGKTSPNPMVGAVIVKDSRIIGQGYHHKFGGNHAEINALQDAQEDATGATMYATLEPCCHRDKKTPPCVDKLLEKKLSRVVIAVKDPNPKVKGKGIEILEKAGIDVKVGVLEKEARDLNEAYFKYMTTGRPLVTLKFAQTLDGRIATATGRSQWISSEQFRKVAHRLRATNDAVIVGIETVLADDPELTVRLAKGRSPLRVVLDSRLRIPLNARALTMQEAAPTLIATTSRADQNRLRRLREMGVEVLALKPDEAGEVDLKDLLVKLGQRAITSVLVEGGAGVITSFLRDRLADHMVVAIAPKLIGKGIEAVGELGIREVSEALKLSIRRVYRLGEDVVIEADF